jgi:hypothetical protein
VRFRTAKVGSRTESKTGSKAMIRGYGCRQFDPVRFRIREKTCWTDVSQLQIRVEAEQKMFRNYAE